MHVSQAQTLRVLYSSANEDDYNRGLYVFYSALSFELKARSSSIQHNIPARWLHGQIPQGARGISRAVKNQPLPLRCFAAQLLLPFNLRILQLYLCIVLA